MLAVVLWSTIAAAAHCSPFSCSLLALLVQADPAAKGFQKERASKVRFSELPP